MKASVVCRISPASGDVPSPAHMPTSGVSGISMGVGDSGM
jgi:hypothetical protein